MKKQPPTCPLAKRTSPSASGQRTLIKLAHPDLSPLPAHTLSPLSFSSIFSSHFAFLVVQSSLPPLHLALENVIVLFCSDCGPLMIPPLLGKILSDLVCESTSTSRSVKQASHR